MTQQAERRRDRTSFQELAKLAQTPPPPSVTDSATGGPLSSPASGPAASSPLVWPSTPNVSTGPWSGADSDSGMVDLKAISQPAPAQQERARTAPLAAEGLFEDAPAAPAASAAPAVPASAPPVQSSVGPLPTSAVAAVPSNVPVQAVPAVSGLIEIPAPKPMPEEKSRAGVIVGVIVGFAAIAAGAFFFVSSHKKPEAVASAPVAAEVKPATPAATQAPPPAATVAVADQPQVAASAAPVAEEAPLAVAAKSGSGRPHGAKTKAGSDKEAPAPAAAAPAPEPPKEAAPTKVASKGGAMDLKGAMENAVGPDGKPKNDKVEPALDTSVRGTQPKPSQGQVQGAIGAVLMKARECLGPDDAVSKANVVFGSDGSVQSVSVSGGAAGKPAEGCIKGALGKAKVPAFADPTYSFPVTVRPL